MASQGMEGVTYACGEWEHGQLGLPTAREFPDPDSTSEPPPPLASAVPSTGPRVTIHPLRVVLSGRWCQLTLSLAPAARLYKPCAGSLPEKSPPGISCLGAGLRQRAADASNPRCRQREYGIEASNQSLEAPASCSKEARDFFRR